MITINNASPRDKKIAIEILAAAFKNDPQTNYIIGDGGDKVKRMERLMAYSFEYCMLNGRVMISEDKKSVALWKNKESKKMNFKLLRETILFLMVFGLRRLSIISKMDKQLETYYPHDESFDYLWVLGTKPEDQGKGYASALIREGIQKAQSDGKDVYLETSTTPNLNYYQKKSFQKYGEFILDGLNPVNVYLLRWTNGARS